jgi:hypothetical protein
MKRFVPGIGLWILICAAVCAHAQSSNPTPPLELRKLNYWVGDWALSGTAKDKPGGPEYKVHWHLHERWILNGFFLEVHQTWKGNGQEQRALEILSYDTGRKIYTDYGFGSDGSKWFLTATFNGATMVESGETKGPDGVTTKCQMTWVFRNRGMALSGTETCEKNGLRWIAVDVTGTKSRLKH